MNDLINLKSISLAENKLTKVNNIPYLSNLTHLLLEDNSITEINSLKNLPNLKYICILNNPLSKEALQIIARFNDIVKIK